MQVSNQEQIFVPNDSLSLATELFYKGSFKKAIDLINIRIKSEDSLANYLKMSVIKSKCFYELNRRDDAKACLEEAMNLNDKVTSSDLLYLKGSLDYFKGDFDLAKTSFKEMLDTTADDEVIFKALLGLGNIAYSNKEKDTAIEYLKELKKMSENLELVDALKLSLDLFEGTVLLYNEIDLARAKEKFEETFHKALDLNWSFFAQRALYNLAKWYKKANQKGESQGILKVLDMYLVRTDSRFLSSLVNHEFHSTVHRSTQKIEICETTCKIFIGSTDKYELELKRWPLLFKFVRILVLNKEFVSKEKIANELWPDKKYLPKNTDPKIYDIVSRLRKRIELTQEAPLLIESGVNGYKINMA